MLASVRGALANTKGEAGKLLPCWLSLARVGAFLDGMKVGDGQREGEWDEWWVVLWEGQPREQVEPPDPKSCPWIAELKQVLLLLPFEVSATLDVRTTAGTRGIIVVFVLKL